VGCQVITVTNDILKKLSLVGHDLDTYSMDTVKMFYSDAGTVAALVPTTIVKMIDQKIDDNEIASLREIAKALESQSESQSESQKWSLRKFFRGLFTLGLNQRHK
jgi:hypothetical protein